MGPANPETKRDLTITTAEGRSFVVESLDEKQAAQLSAMLRGLNVPYVPLISWVPVPEPEPWPSELG